jgi:solute:Na+ symporter, SSS family
MTTQLRIPILDLCIIVAYILAILCVGVIASRKTKVTGQVFFLAGRSLPWGVVGASLFASNISTIHLVGLTASGYNEGLVWGNFEWMAAFTLMLLAIVFAPFYFRSRISTLPEFLERRYSPASRSILAFMAILAALFIHIGMSLYAGAAVSARSSGLNRSIPLCFLPGLVALPSLRWRHCPRTVFTHFYSFALR